MNRNSLPRWMVTGSFVVIAAALCLAGCADSPGSQSTQQNDMSGDGYREPLPAIDVPTHSSSPRPAGATGREGAVIA